MKSQIFDSLAFLSLLIVYSLSHISFAHPNVHKPYSLESIKHVKGSQKGDKVEGLHHLKRYLNRFGYLEDRFLNNHEVDNDEFDENTEIALKTYQLNFNLKPTGILDNETVLLVMKPRCGVPDIINGRTRMNSAGSYNINYAFFPGKPKWPKTPSILKWAVQPGTAKDLIDPIRDHVFPQWKEATPFFYFLIGENLTAANIKLTFPIDGTVPKGINAYGYRPTDGRVQFNGDLKWVFGAVKGAFDVVSVGLHEIGHVLGLDHSSVKEAVMWPYYGSGTKKQNLAADDLQGMATLYDL